MVRGPLWGCCSSAATASAVGRHQDAAQIRMVHEADAEQIEDFPFVPVGAAPHAGHGIDHRIGAAQAAFQADAFLPFDGV